FSELLTFAASQDTGLSDFKGGTTTETKVLKDKLEGQGGRAGRGERADHVPGEQVDGASQPSPRLDGADELGGQLGEHECVRGATTGGCQRGQPRDRAVRAGGSSRTGSLAMQSLHHDGSLEPDLRGLRERQGITQACRKRMQHESRKLVASALCVAVSLLALTSNSLDVFEFGSDTLSPAFRDEGLLCETATVAQGYHLDNIEDIKKMNVKVAAADPKLLWLNLPDQRLLWMDKAMAPNQWRNVVRARRRDLAAAEQAAEAMVARIQGGKHFAWMGRADSQAWKGRAVAAIKGAARDCHVDVYECVVDGCCYDRGPAPSPERWKILTNVKQLYYKLGRRVCPGHRAHGDRDVKAAAIPEAMIRDIVDAVSWDLRLRHGSLRDDVENYLAGEVSKDETNQVSVMTHQIDAKANLIDTKADQINTKADQINTKADQINSKADLFNTVGGQDDALTLRGGDSSARDLLPLQRMALPPEKPTGRKLEEVKSALLRMHRAAGHSSMESLARLLEKRGAARWASELARSLKCDDCEESRRISPVPPASTEEQPSLWETLGLDVFEYEYEAGGTKMKAKYLLFQDRASRYCMTKLLKTYPAVDNWEPTTGEVKSALVTGWLATNPSPVWIITDSAPYFVSTEMADFCSRSGIGLMTAPAEAHWLVGQEERRIQTLKRTAARLEKESLGLSIEEIFALAVHGANSSLNASGFTPFQWTHGWQRDEIESLPDGINPKRGFSRMLAFREKARAAFVKSDAAEKLSRLNNAVQRRAAQYQAGGLVMLWRQRIRQGKGGWTGPLRVLLQEGSTVWLATGATIIRAKTNQVRPCSKREEIVHSTKGMSVIKNPVTMSTLLRGYTGRHYVDASQVRVEPDASRKRTVRDKWERRGDTLVRIHGTPRLTLFTPDKVQECPVRESSFTGKRRTFVQATGGTKQQLIEDDYKSEGKPNRGLLERWTGETHFELKGEPSQSSAPSEPVKAPTVETSSAPAAASEPPPEAAVPPTPGAVPGTPGQLAARVPLPPDLEEEAARSAAYESSSDSSSSSSSEEELVPDRAPPTERKRKAETELSRKGVQENMLAVTCTIDVNKKDLSKLLRKPKRAAIWMSQKMAEKSKEVSWQKLSYEEKLEFDEAQAVELSNVLSSAAVRALAMSETGTWTTPK
ncbi:GIP, partial [Symbiodinium microadriaticum]